MIHDPEEMVPNTDDEKIIFVSDIYHTYGSVVSLSCHSLSHTLSLIYEPF